MEFTLMCECGSSMFNYDEIRGFQCLQCGNIYEEDEAGSNLIATDSEI